MLVNLEPRAPAPVGPSLHLRVDPAAVMVRPACIADMERVEPLINGFARRGVMLPKTREQLFRTFREFVLAVDAHDRLLGCVALRVYTPGIAEVSALAVAEAAHGQGVGRRLLEALEAGASALGLSTLFALTLEPGFFHRLGYETVAREVFPLKIAADCTGCPRAQECREITVAKQITMHGKVVQ